VVGGGGGERNQFNWGLWGGFRGGWGGGFLGGGGVVCVDGGWDTGGGFWRGVGFAPFQPLGFVDQGMVGKNKIFLGGIDTRPFLGQPSTLCLFS